MAMIRNPLNRHQFIRINDIYDNQDVVIPNESPQTREFKDVENPNQLTQNSWNFSPKTRADEYRDIVVSNPAIIGRLERDKTPQRPGRYHGRVRR